MEVGINSPPIKQVVALYLQKPAWPDVRTDLELVFSNRLVIALSVCKIGLANLGNWPSRISLTAHKMLSQLC